MSAAHHLGQQLQLFAPEETRERTPGEVSFEEWRQDPNVRYHATFHPFWEQNPVQHFGTLGQATERLHFTASGLKGGPTYRQAYYSGESSDFDDDYSAESTVVGDDDDGDYRQTHVGRIYARKLPAAAGPPVRDRDANRADIAYRAKEGYETWEMPSSIRSSAGQYLPDFMPDELYAHLTRTDSVVRESVQALDEGKRVDYRNEAEAGSAFESNRFSKWDSPWPGHSYDPTSSMVARGNTSSWEREQLADPNASTMRKSFAQQRIASGQEGAVPFERAEPGGYYQNKFTGGGVGLIKPPVEERRNLNSIQFTTGADD